MARDDSGHVGYSLGSMVTLLRAGACCVLLAGVSGTARAGTPPPLLVPARPESVTIESEPAPLLVPGRSAPPDTAVPTRERFARRQLALGYAMERDGNLPAALLAYANAVKVDSTLKDASFRLGRLYLKMNRAADAERMFREELRRDPGRADASRELAIALSTGGRHAAAIQRLRRLVAREPRRDEHWY